MLAGVQLTRKRASSPWLFLAAVIVQRLSGSLPLPVAARALDSLAVPLVAFFVLLVRTYSGSRAHNFQLALACKLSASLLACGIGVSVKTIVPGVGIEPTRAL